MVAPLAVATLGLVESVIEIPPSNLEAHLLKEGVGGDSRSAAAS
jgi:hypothetical protein